MTPDLFQPIGDRPRWEMIVEAMQPLDVGDILTYQQIADALEEPEWRNTFRTSFYKAANVWGEEHHRAFRAVPNVGYRVVEAAEHEALARLHHRKSRRQIHKARTVIGRADRTELTAEQAERFDAIEITLGRQADMIRRLDRRMDRHETALKSARSEQSSTESRVQFLEETLRRNGLLT